MRGVFVTGTDTGVGKTVVSALLVAGTAGRAAYWKPVQTGASDDDDTETVRRLAGAGEERLVPPAVRLELPASPHHAAAVAGRRIALDDLVAHARRHGLPDRPHVVEGAGGLLVPLDERHLLCELPAALGLPLVIVASTRLGAINHCLLTLREAARRELRVLGLVLSGPADAALESALAHHATPPVLARVPWLSSLDPDAVRREGERLSAAPVLAEALA